MIADSGDRTKFKTGAVRDMHEGKCNHIAENKEVWKAVVGYDGIYEVSNIGRVRSLRTGTRIKDKSERIMRQKTDNKGYLRVNLHKNKKCKAELVSRLVAMAFIPNPLCYMEVGHNDDNKTNNTVENLYWTNRTENLTHNNLHLKIRDKRQNNIHRVIDALSVPVIGTNIDTGQEIRFSSMHEAEKAGLGFDSSKISICCAGKRLTHKGYKWRKENG